MDIPCSVAITGAEFHSAQTLPEHLAWMACHFSSTGSGLSNLPKNLPPGSIVMVDDSSPPHAHDPEQITTELMQLLDFQVSAILLDFQRPQLEENARLAQFLVKRLPCTVCVTPHYAADLDCPVLLSPPPLHLPLEEHLEPWHTRQVWLEALLESEQITVTKEGSTVSSLPFSPLEGDNFADTALFCRYQIQVLQDRAVFTLTRDEDMLKSMLSTAARLGARQAVGLYQQFGLSSLL